MNDFDAQEALLQERRRQYAQQLAGAQAPQGRMAGNVFVRSNPLEFLAAGLRGVGAMQGQQQAEQELKSLQGQRAEGTQKALAEFLRQSQGTPEYTLPPDQAGPVQPAQAPNMQGAYAALMQAPDQNLRQMGMQGMVQIPQLEAAAAQRVADMEFKRQEAEAARQARVDQLNLAHQQRMESLQLQNASREQMAQAQREFQQQMQQERLQSQREMRALTGAVASAAGGVKAPAGYRFTPEGNLEAIPGGPAANKDGQKPLTESQAKGSLYLGQMRSATTELEKLPSVSPVQTAMTGSTFTNFAAGKDAQRVAQLQNQWAEAYLRAKTGAAATADEVKGNIRTFFPVVGDTKEVIAQKEAMRKQAERDMVPVAGPGAVNAGGASGELGDSPAPPAPQRRIRYDAQGNPIQ